MRFGKHCKLLVEQGDMIRAVAPDHQVDPQYVLSILGVESNYGKFPLTLSVFDVVATLAFDTRRSAQFRSELLANFEILDNGHATLDMMKGSWAGTLGYPQFNATNYLKLAVDQDGDGRKDLWSRGPDLIGSVANYLEVSGWQEGRQWGQHVALPANLGALTGAQADGLTPHPGLQALHDLRHLAHGGGLAGARRTHAGWHRASAGRRNCRADHR